MKSGKPSLIFRLTGGEYRGRTDDLLHAMRRLTDIEWFKVAQ